MHGILWKFLPSQTVESNKVETQCTLSESKPKICKIKSFLLFLCHLKPKSMGRYLSIFSQFFQLNFFFLKKFEFIARFKKCLGGLSHPHFQKTCPWSTTTQSVVSLPDALTSSYPPRLLLPEGLSGGLSVNSLSGTLPSEEFSAARHWCLFKGR